MSKFLNTYHGFNPEAEGASAIAWFWGLMSIGCLLGLLVLKLVDSARGQTGIARIPSRLAEHCPILPHVVCSLERPGDPGESTLNPLAFRREKKAIAAVDAIEKGGSRPLSRTKPTKLSQTNGLPPQKQNRWPPRRLPQRCRYLRKLPQS